MSDRTAFIDAILNSPDDDTARLVFADWLEEHGEHERAEFVRVQITFSCLPEGARNRSALAEHINNLLRDHEGHWRAAVGLLHRGGSYNRGFLSGVRMSSAEFVTRARTALAREPVQITLDLLGFDANGDLIPDEQLTELAGSADLRAVSQINSQTGGFGDLFPQLLCSPHLTNLTRIVAFEDRIGSAGVRALAQSPSAFRLDLLDLNGAIGSDDDDESDDAVEAVTLLATDPRFTSLTSLALPFNSLGDRSVEALLASQTLRPDLQLDLTENTYDREKYDAALAARFVYDADW